MVIIYRDTVQVIFIYLRPLYVELYIINQCYLKISNVSYVKSTLLINVPKIIMNQIKYYIIMHNIRKQHYR